MITILLLACAPEPGREPACEKVERLLQRLAGSSSVDCGTAENSIRGPTDACAVKSFESGVAFRARYDWSDIHTSGTDAWASDGKTLFLTSYLRSTPEHDSLAYSECASPTVSADTGDPGAYRIGDETQSSVIDCAYLGPRVVFCDSDE